MRESNRLPGGKLIVPLIACYPAVATPALGAANGGSRTKGGRSRGPDEEFLLGEGKLLYWRFLADMIETYGLDPIRFQDRDIHVPDGSKVVEPRELAPLSVNWHDPRYPNGPTGSHTNG